MCRDGRVPPRPALEDDGLRAARSALELHERVRSLSAAWEGVVAVGQAPQRSIVRNNTFTNVGAAVFFMGSSLKVEDNDMSAPEPELIPVDGDPFAAVFAFVWDLLATGPCDHNIIDRNRIDGYAVGIGLEVVAGESCSHNVIRDNAVSASRIS